MDPFFGISPGIRALIVKEVLKPRRKSCEAYLAGVGVDQRDADVARGRLLELAFLTELCADRDEPRS